MIKLILRRLMWLILIGLLFSVFEVTAQAGDLPLLNSEFWFLSETIAPTKDSRKDIQPAIPKTENSGTSAQSAASAESNASTNSVQSVTKEQETKDNIKDVLNEAVFVFSGMIYGFNFSYTPSDVKRNVKEEFTVTPNASIVFGDPLLEIKSTRREEGRSYVRIIYRCADQHKNWLSFWQSSKYPIINSTGKTDIKLGADTKREAIELAAKEAIRSYMRTKTHNKPKTITGSFAFIEPPIVGYFGGLYSASVKIKLNAAGIDSYSVF